MGYLGFDSVKTKKSWSNDDIALLRMVGNTFISAIQRKITEQSLVEERDFAQMVVNTMGQGLVMTNIEGRFQFVNPAYARMLGYSPEELVGKSPTEFIHPEDVAKRNEAFRNSLSGKNNTYETRLIHRKGRILYVTVTAVPIYRENQFKGAIAVITDITGRKLGEIALRESEERLRSVVSNVPLMLFAVDQNEVVTFAEGRGFRELGVDPAQMVGHSIKRPFNADDISIAEKIHQALEGEETHAILPMRGKAYELWFSPVKERGEQVSSAIGVGLDVSERLRAEKALQYRLQFEQLIAAISTNFINVAVGEIDREINQALATIGQFSGADRSYIFLFSEDGKLMNNTHEWCGEEIEPQIEMLQDLPSDSFPWLTEQIQRLENIHLPSLDLIPEEGQNVREVLEMQAIQSLILVPMVYEKKAVGYLGFDVVKAKKSWSNDDIALLRMVGNTFISAIRRKITEQSLIEERDFAQMVTNTMGQGLIVLNSEGYFQFINPVFERMLGYPLEELSGKSPSEFIPPEDRYIYANALFSRIQGKTTTHEHRLIHRTGKLIYVTVTGVPLFRENQFKGIISVITDITDRKQAEEALRQSEHRLQTVVSNVPMMLFAIDQSKVITFAEGQSLKELGMEPTRMVGHS
ncbi:MAG: PAS domain S-box protein, partial [Chloroflexota bacterium]